MIVLDTNVVSVLMHREDAALEELARHEPSELVLTAPVAAEIAYGLQRLPDSSRRRVLLEAEYGRLRAAVRWQDWNEAAAERFGALKANLERRGEALEDMDVAIAAIALAVGARIATRNVRHFDRVEGLLVERW